MSQNEQGRRSAAALTVFAVLACAVAAAGYLQADDEADQGRRYLRNASGAVLFDHASHQQRSEACVRCHHELVDGDAADCADCHDDPDYAPDMTDHAELVELHQAACDNCHDVADDASAENCRSCHDETISEVYHSSCNGCHLAEAPARFADEEGQAACSNCHLK